MSFLLSRFARFICIYFVLPRFPLFYLRFVESPYRAALFVYRYFTFIVSYCYRGDTLDLRPLSLPLCSSLSLQLTPN
jgi:hypothetical protein